MADTPSARRTTGTQQAPEPSATTVAHLPSSNAITAILITVSVLLATIAVLILVPGQVEALGTAATIAGSGFALAAKIAIPRR